MPNTTIAAIRLSLLNTIEGTVPLATVDPWGSPSYSHNPEGLDGSATADMDREFCLDQFSPGSPTMFGAGTENDYLGSFRLRIAHVLREGDSEAARSRADSDIGQLRRVLEKVTNHPTAVSMIRLQDVAQAVRTVSDEKFLESTLTFQIHYTLAAV